MGDESRAGINRREFVAAVGAASVAAQGLMSCASTHGTEVRSANERPNILFILADQHRADCIGAYGHPSIRTPHIDALAKDGVRYEHCHCAYPVCTPSRYSMLSGLYVHEHEGSNNQATLHPEVETFPKLLRKAGYKTAAVGKMHFTPTYLDVGFEQMVLSEQDGDGRWDDDFHCELMKHGLVDVNDLEDQRREYRAHARPEYWENNGALPSSLPLEFHPTEWTGRQGLKFIDGWGDGGNMLMVSFIKPHHPFDPPESMCGLYDPKTLNLPPGWTKQCFAHDLELNMGYFPHEKLNDTLLRHIAAYYYANIEHIDQQVGKMIDALKKKGLYDNTVIVYAADHGEYMGYHHMLLKGGYMYEPLTRVSLIIKYPRGYRAGTTSDGLVSLIDLAPTFLRQAGCARGSRMHGLDLADKHAGREVVFSEATAFDQVMARTATHKLLLAREKKQGLLYDLKRDPHEQMNEYDNPKYREVREYLTKKLEEWRPAPMPVPYRDPDAPTIQQSNVPGKDLAQRPGISEYFRGKMAGAGIVV